MQERFGALRDRIKAFLDKYTRRQKVIMASVISIVVVFLIVMLAVFSGDKYVTLIVCKDYAQVAEVQAILDEGGYTYQVGDDAISIQVLEEEYARATVAVNSANILTDNFDYSTLQNLLSGGFSQTQSDKEKLYKAYLQDEIRQTLQKLDYVKSASIIMTQPSASYSVLVSEQETSVTAFLTLSSAMPDGAAETLARFIATAVGNKTTDNISIIDNDGNLLFTGDGSSVESNGVSARTQNDIRSSATGEIIGNVKSLLAGLQYDEINVSPHLDINFDKISTTNVTYDTGDRKQGPYTNSYEVDQTGSSGSGGIVGTDSNDADITTYNIDTGNGSESKYSLKKYEYAVNETVTTKDEAVGKIDYDNSSLSIVLNKYQFYNEDNVKTAGLLDDMSWDEFKALNAAPVPIEIDDQLIQLVSYATGFEMGKISIVANTVPMFQSSDSSGADIASFLPFILVGVILVFLIFAVMRSLRPVAVDSVEPELSVEELLASTKEKTPVEDIDLNDKSDIRIAIEKFVDEQPEAVALLLRNWLNDDWG